MPVEPLDFRQRVRDTVERGYGSWVQLKNVLNWTRRSSRHRDWLAGHLTFAAVFAIVGWLISAFAEKTHDVPAMSAEAFVERCLSTQMEKAYGDNEAGKIPGNLKIDQFKLFKNDSIYKIILRDVKQFEEKNGLVRIAANDI